MHTRWFFHCFLLFVIDVFLICLDTWIFLFSFNKFIITFSSFLLSIFKVVFRSQLSLDLDKTLQLIALDNIFRHQLPLNLHKPFRLILDFLLRNQVSVNGNESLRISYFLFRNQISFNVHKALAMNDYLGSLLNLRLF